MLVVPPARETIVDRIDRLVKAAVADGRFPSANVFWSEEGCGLSRSYLHQFRSRLKADPDATMTIDTARKIAEALGLPVKAVTGDTPALDRYPNRARAIESARNLDLPEHAIARVLRENPGYDLPRLAWFMRIFAEAQSVRPAADR